MSEPITKILTLNIRYPEVEDGVNFWPNRARIVHDFIDEADADIVCLQEVRPSVKEEFIKNHSKYSFWGDFRFVPPREYDETTLIGFKNDRYELIEGCRRWLSSTPDVPESKYIPDTFWPRIYVELKLLERASCRKFYVINTHFELDDYSVAQSFKQLQARARELTDLGYAVLLAGDFNREYEFLSSVDDGTLYDLTSSVPYTYHAYGKTKAKIDYIFSNSYKEALCVELVEKVEDEKFISDHFPIICEIML